MNIAFIGAGEIGTAIYDLIKEKKHLIKRWDLKEGLVPNQLSMEETLKDAEIVFVCVPSKFVRSVAKATKDFIEKDAVVVSISKGIEEESYKTMDIVLEEELNPGQSIALVSGPMLGEELSDRLIGAAVIASENKEALAKLKGLFKDSRLKVETSTDVYSTALTGVLKNIFAISMGCFDALCYGMNARGWLVYKSISEMSDILKLLKADPARALSLSGLGDLIATGSTPYSSNYTLGYEIASGRGESLESEGQISIPSMLTMLGEDFEKFEILNAVMQIVMEGKSAKEIFDKILYARVLSY